MVDLPPRARLPLLALGFVSLVAGVFSGLARLGFAVDATASALVPWHGPLMVAGFFGTVIALERAVATARLWAYAAPLAAGAAGIALFAREPSVAAALASGGAAVLVLASLRFVAMQPALFTATVAGGAIALLGGNLLWYASARPSAATAAWIAFIVLTVAGERLELTRLMPKSPAARAGFAAIALAGAVGTALAFDPAGARLAGAAWLALALWLARHDLARRTIRESGATRYMAVALLAGYAWLALGGAIILSAGLAPGTRAYDAALHAILVGFAFSMVFAHAPVIVPAVLRVKLPYAPVLYAPLALLHASVALRVAGDAAGPAGLLAAGAFGNALALAAFIATALTLALRARRAASPAAGD